MVVINITWREATVRRIESQLADSERTSSKTLTRELKLDRPLPNQLDWADDRGLQLRAPRLCLIGVRPDGTRHCLLGGLLSFDQAARARMIMRDSHAYVEYKSIRIMRDDRFRESVAIRGN